MADLAALHQAVVAAPEDDGPRLAYADAVGATDPDRAEYIRNELKIANWRKAQIDPPEATALSVRSQQLQDRHGKDWAKALQALVSKWQYLRGFPEMIWIDAADFATKAPEIYRTAPVLHLFLSGVKPAAAQLFGSSHLARIHSLTLSNNGLDDADITVLAGSSNLGSLRWLDIGNNKFGAPGLAALAASNKLPRLAYVRLDGNPVEDPTPRHGDEYDADAPAATELQKQYGKRAWLSVEAARKFLKWPPDRDVMS